MAYIKVEVDYPIEDGMSLTLKAPCDCTAVTGLKVYYPVMTESESTTTNKVFSFKDAHNNALTSVGNLFTQNAYIKVILDVTNGVAFIQNQDTNKYLEDKFSTLNTSLLNKTRRTQFEYLGTGDYGSGYPNSEPFTDEIPSVIYIQGLSTSTSIILVPRIHFGLSFSTENGGSIDALSVSYKINTTNEGDDSFSGNVEWYSTKNDLVQGNGQDNYEGVIIY